MLFVRTFKGYEDRTAELDKKVNDWVSDNRIDVADMKVVLSHEPGARAQSGDLIYCVIYRANAPIGD